MRYEMVQCDEMDPDVKPAVDELRTLAPFEKLTSLLSLYVARPRTALDESSFRSSLDV